MKKICPLTPFLLLILTACHKNDAGNTYTNVVPISYTTYNNALNAPIGAAGALYASNVGQTQGGTINSYADAWFINDTNTANAGLVSVSGNVLSIIQDTANGTANSSYSSDSGMIFSSNILQWSVQGNSTNGIPPISHTDTLPNLIGLSIPSSVNVQSGLTINFTTTGAYDTIYYNLNSNEGSYNYMGASTTSASFSTAQLRLCLNGGGKVVISVTAVKHTPYTNAGKTFYFVKESFYFLVTNLQ